MNEADTRAKYIDPQLKAAGWTDDDLANIQREYHITHGAITADGRHDGGMRADYVLSYKNRKLAVIEAKGSTIDVHKGIAQAKKYAQKLQLATAFATNGKIIYEISPQSGQQKIITHFPTPQELWQRTFAKIDTWMSRFNAVPWKQENDQHTRRYYQELAVNHAMQAIADNKSRVLLALATGTGKTHIAFQIAWKLFKSRWNLQRNGNGRPRILFLADRNILANQALLGFSAFAEDACVRVDVDSIKKRGDKVPKNHSIFFPIFQTLMSKKDEMHYFTQYEADFFDAVIIDECHRGGAREDSSWRDILEYFVRAVHIGLTATPKRDANVDTYTYFGSPVFTYSLKAGIEDGFLTPFRVQRITSNIDEYQYAAGDTAQGAALNTEHVYGEDEFNRIIVSKDRERKRVQDLLEIIGKNAQTLVFCRDQKHAALVQELISQELHSSDSNYCVRVCANDGKDGDTHLRQFQQNDKSAPTILTTSTKLSTGVDARNIRYIAFLRPVKQMIEFKQIIGRGTRVYEGKSHFTIVDFVGAYTLFNDPEWDGDPISVESKETPPPTSMVADPSPPYGKDPEAVHAPKEPRMLPSTIQIQLSKERVCHLKSTAEVLFLVNGATMNATEFMQQLYHTVTLPFFPKDEAKLRQIWIDSQERKALLKRLTHNGCNKNELGRLQALIEPPDSDLFDVLAYVAYATAPMGRRARVRAVKNSIYATLNTAEKEFVSYVLTNYINNGIDEVNSTNFTTILEAKYRTVTDALHTLGSTAEQIKHIFTMLPRHLYAPSTA